MYSPVTGIDQSTDTTTGTFGGGPASTGRGRTVPSSTHTYANFAVIAWFIIAALGLVALDKGGFKFMVKVGRG